MLELNSNEYSLRTYQDINSKQKNEESAKLDYGLKTSGV